ncbi:MAG: ISKra4 family transposase [Deltaproteobacteria bacterium]|nr:ISKra4 family transposase [Deltaproteobacteria bacterium]
MEGYPKSIDFAGADAAFDELKQFLDAGGTLCHDELEAGVAQRGREVARRALQDFLDHRAAGERRRPVVIGRDGVARHRVEKSSRALDTIVGPVRVGRLAYRTPGAPNAHPVDADLNLPRSKASLGVRQMAADRASRGSFEASTRDLCAATGLSIGKRQVEELVGHFSQDIESFYDGLEHDRAPSDDVLVLSIDGKGVVVRPQDLREATRKRAQNTTPKLEKRASRGEPKGRKRTVMLSVTYDVSPRPRRVEDVLDGGKARLRSKRPKPRGKRYRIDLEDNTEQAVAKLFDDAERRDPKRKRPWVLLVDGDMRIHRPIRRELARRKLRNVFVLIDIVHVIEYLWAAAWSFFREGDRKAEQWVRTQLLALLEGNAKLIPRRLRAKATKAKLTGAKRKKVDDAANYIQKRYSELRFDEALARGFPIATGVIEGACRHIIADRMAITGARWSIAGAEAVLRIRTLRCSGHFEEYSRFHADRERERNHDLRDAA